jgi:hypothetical protein
LHLRGVDLAARVAAALLEGVTTTWSVGSRRSAHFPAVSRCASRGWSIGASAFLADLRSAHLRRQSKPAPVATQ